MIKIGTLAQAMNVSVRTLHHYDEIGLLKPKIEEKTQHRFYDEEDVERLRRILLYKYVGFSLTDIDDILKRDFDDQKKILKNQRSYLIQQRNEMSDMIAYIDTLEYGDGKHNVSQLPTGDRANAHLQTKEEQAELEQGVVDAYDKIASLMDKDPSDDDVQSAMIDLYHAMNAREGGYLSVDMFLRIFNDTILHDQVLVELNAMHEGFALFFMDALNSFEEN